MVTKSLRSSISTSLYLVGAVVTTVSSTINGLISLVPPAMRWTEQQLREETRRGNNNFIYSDPRIVVANLSTTEELTIFSVV